jgi:hypothetical protein
MGASLHNCRLVRVGRMIGLFIALIAIIGPLAAQETDDGNHAKQFDERERAALHGTDLCNGFSVLLLIR